jgi:hypothetical protein
MNITWNNQATEVTNCNATARTSVVSTTYDTSQYYSFDFTADANTEYLDDKSFTLQMKMMPQGYYATARRIWFTPKENSQPDQRPYFEITYSYTYTAEGINFYINDEETNTNMNFNMTLFNSWVERFTPIVAAGALITRSIIRSRGDRVRLPLTCSW